MFKKIVLTFAFAVIYMSTFAQNSINNYKYIIIPNAFEFSKSDDQYQLNSLAKFLFNKYGYEAYFLDELPEDLKKERCLGLVSEVSNDKSNMFSTKLEISLKDCYDQVVMTSELGESRLKEFDKAYNLALRGAFETFQNFDYAYVKASNNTMDAEMVTAEVELVSTEALSSEKKVEPETTAETKVATAKVDVATDNTTNLFYAQAVSGGYQLVNSEPKVVMVLWVTDAKDVFLVKGKNAIVFNKNGTWVYSENDGKTVTNKVLNIKF